MLIVADVINDERETACMCTFWFIERSDHLVQASRNGRKFLRYESMGGWLMNSLRDYLCEFQLWL